VVGGALVAAAAVSGYLVFGRGAPAPRASAPTRVDTVPVQEPGFVPPRAADPRTRERVAVPPVASLGYITVNAEPYGELYIDGVDVGPTPVVRHRVPAGVHTIKVVREGFKSVEEKVQVDAGNTVPKRYTLLPEQ
jgi:hypothetical protein